MSQWADIESAVAETVAPGRTTHGTVVGLAAPRLRRSERLVLGSIDGAAHVLQRRAREVLVGSAVFMVPMVGVGVLLAVLAFDRFDSLDNLLGDRGYVGAEAAFALLAIALQSLTAHLIGAYVAVYLVRYQMGGDPRVGSCVRAVARRLPMLVATWLATHWWSLLLALWLVNADALTRVVLGWMLPPFVAVASTLVLLVAPVMMGEGLGLSAIPRAWRLVRTRFGAGYGFVCSCAVLASLLFLFIAFLPPLIESTGLFTFGSYLWLVQGVTLQLAMLIVMPFSAIATAQFYLQLRVHAEGLDIMLAADRAFRSSR